MSKQLDKNKAIRDVKVGKICMHCLGEFDNINPIRISGMGYGSIFDMTTTQIDLCDECKSLKPNEWWDMKEVEDHRLTRDDIEDPDDDFMDIIFHKIEFEREILDFIKTFPLAGQELFANRYDREYYMKPQDWIDYELKILPYNKCKEYGLYAYEEIDAYQNRFPVCGNVYLKVHSDGSKGTGCKAHSFVSGNADGTCSSNISKECFGCTYFEIREGKMDTVDVVEDFYKRELESTNQKLELLNKYKEKLENREIDEEEIY